MRLRHISIFASLAIMIAAILWAVDGILLTPWITDLGLWDVPTFVFMLHAVATIFLSYFLITKREEIKKLNKQDWTAFILTGLFGGAIGTMAIIAAIINVHNNDLNISVVLLLQKLQPIFAILLAITFLKERPKKIFYLLAVIALLGSYFLTFGFDKVDWNANNMLTPAILALIAAFAFGSSTVFSKKAITKISHGLSTSLRFTITTGIMLIIIIIISILNSAGINTNYEGFSGFKAINWEIIGVFILIALTTGGTAIFIYYWGLKKILASRATIFELMFPVSAIILEYFINDKTLTTGQWVGALIVLVTITIIVNLKNGRKKLNS
ncbi:MAG: DMT family transporter [Candidatus Kerfeldbacteria bacterium]|jgi:drug/metabolite transporter (DMT)-like permease